MPIYKYFLIGLNYRNLLKASQKKVPDQILVLIYTCIKFVFCMASITAYVLVKCVYGIFKIIPLNLQN